jgi:hypothetical protein
MRIPGSKRGLRKLNKSGSRSGGGRKDRKDKKDLGMEIKRGKLQLIHRGNQFDSHRLGGRSGGW